MQVYQYGDDYRRFSSLDHTDEDMLSALQLEHITNSHKPLPGIVQKLLPIRAVLSRTGFHDSDQNNLMRGDIAYLSSCYICMSPRAKAALEPLISEHGVFLPIDCPDADYTAFFVTTFPDLEVIDLQRSDVTCFRDGRLQAFRPRNGKVFFDPNYLSTLPPIFKLSYAGTYLVTDQFMKVIEREKITGTACELIWPHPDPSTERQRFLEKRKRKKGR